MTIIPFFTIVIPTYNRARFIINTIDSILQQKYRNYELIVIDDGSTDNTESLVRNIDDERVKYIKKENGERGAARNKGVEFSRGEYINFIDSDDLIYPNHLATAHRFIIERKPEIFHLGYDIKDPNLNFEREVNDLPDPINNKLIFGNYLSCNGVFIKREVIEKNRFNEDRTLSASEDYELWLRIASKHKIHINNQVTSTIINHDSRSVLKINKGKFLARIEKLKDLVSSNPEIVGYYRKKIKIFLAYTNVYAALHLAMARESKSLIFKYLVLSLNKRPLVIFSRRFWAVIKNALT